MGDGPLRSSSGKHHGRKGGNYGGGSPGFAIDFNDFNRRPNSRHFETKGHRSRHSQSNYDDYSSDDDDYSEDDYSDESEDEQYPDEEEELPL